MILDTDIHSITDEVWEFNQNFLHEVLTHRDGTFFEDLAFVNTVSHKSLINKDYNFYDEKNKVSACKPNKPMIEMLQAAANSTIIGIHNHPQSRIPSDSDILRAYERKYKYGGDSMKEKIEKKLGCTIEQFIQRRQEQRNWASENDLEVDAPTGLENLTEEEVLFMAGYAKKMEKDVLQHTCV